MSDTESGIIPKPYEVVTTICSKPLDDAMDAVVAMARAKDDPATQGMQDDVLKVGLRPFVKERVVADAVQAKAGIGAFAASH